MKFARLATLGLSTLIVIAILDACSSGKTALEHGNYYQAVITSVGHLRRNTDHKKSIETLKSAYPLARVYHEDRAASAVQSNAEFKWREVVQQYTALQTMYDEIQRAPGALAVVPNPTSYSAKLSEAQQNAAEESYVAGNKSLAVGDHVNSKKAYYLFIDCNGYVPGYKDVAKKITDAKWAATVKVLVEPVPAMARTYSISSQYFDNKLNEFLHTASVNEFVKFYSPAEIKSQNISADQIVKLSFDEFSVGQTLVNQKESQPEKDSVVVAVSFTDSKGAVQRKDTEPLKMPANLVNSTVIAPANNAEIEKAAREAADKAAKEKADKDLADKNAKDKADKDLADKVAKEKADKDLADKNAKDKADKDLADKVAKEKADKDLADKNAKDKADKDLADKVAKEKADKDLADKNAKDKADKDLADKVAKEKADKDLADKDAKDKADKDLADKVAKEKADKDLADKNAKDKADKDLADKVAKEKADKDLADKNAKDKADKDLADKVAKEKADKDLTDKNAKDKADKDLADKLAKEKADKDLADKNAKDKADKDLADKVAKEKADKDLADKNAKDKADKDLADKVEKDKADKEKADKELADKVAKEKTDKDLADKAAKEKADKDLADKIEKEKADKDKADKELAEKVAKEKEEKEKADKEKADKEKQEKDQNDNDKVTICHQPPGNSGERKTMTVPKSALQAHLDHGDKLGECSKDEEEKKDEKGKKKDNSLGAISWSHSKSVMIASSGSLEKLWSYFDAESNVMDTTKIYGKVKANVRQYKKTITSKGILNFRIVDAHTNAVLTEQRIPGEHIWESEWLTYNGDGRALTADQLKMAAQKEKTPPTNQDLFAAFTQPIFDQITAKIKDFYKGY
jgi:hypothetical protein